MKVLLSIFSFLILFSAKAHTDKNQVSSTAREVTVYLHGAQVTRYATFSPKKGRNDFVVTGVSPSADANSLQVLAPNGITILEVKPLPSHEKTVENQEKSDVLNDSIQLVLDQMENIRVEIQALNHKETFLMANSRIKGTTTLTAEQFAASTAFYSTQIQQVLQKKLELKRQLEQQNEVLSVLRNKMRMKISDSKEADLHVHVSLLAENTSPTSLRLSYFVKEAGWRPSYDIRVENVTEPLELVYKAQFYQNTKEDWENVEITFSNANPIKSGNAPTLEPYYLYYGRYYVPRNAQVNAQSYLGIEQQSLQGRVTDVYGKGIPFAEITGHGSGFNTFADEHGYFSLQFPKQYRRIRVSAIGYQTIYLNAGDQFLQASLRAVDLALHADEKKTDERYAGLYKNSNDLNPGLIGNNKNYFSVDSDGVADQFDVMADDISFKGSRTDETATYVDGIRVKKKEEYRSNGKAGKSLTYSFGTGNASNRNNLEINQTSVNYVLADRMSMASGEAPKMVVLKSEKLNAYYEYRAVPKLEEAAFLIAQITDWSKLNLLEGEANIYFENAYTGKSVLDVRFLKDTLDISLGRDESVVVKREKVQTYSGNKLVGKNTVAKRQFDIKVRNGKNQPINLVIYDQLPVSTRKDIEVFDSQYEGAKLDKKKGELTWEATLTSGKSKTLSFRYSVKYNQGSIINLE
jgi:hypothetical protein